MYHWLNGLWSPSGIETKHTHNLLYGIYPWLNGLWNPPGIEEDYPLDAGLLPDARAENDHEKAGLFLHKPALALGWLFPYTGALQLP